ncbi:MAG TPA: NAD(P)-dependent oxidoreductase [bacterium]|nr:NAD(P)-dependent oxidoreductase [bacterium]
MRIALLGTGLMGYAMAERLLEKEYALSVYNRTASKAAPLGDLGANVCESPEEAVGEADCVILMVGDARAIEHVLFTENGEFAEKTILQMGTIAPEESIEFHNRITAAGGEYLEAPVLGNKHHARKGELILMVGGSSEQFGEWKPLLQVFGESTHHAGPVGAAAAMKLALNQLIASLTASFGLSVQFIRKNQGDLDLFMDIVRESALYAPQYDKKLSKILQHDYSDPNFSTRHLLKDVNLMLQAAKSSELEVAALDGVRKIVEQALEKGYEDEDYSSLVEGILLEDTG